MTPREEAEKLHDKPGCDCGPKHAYADCRQIDAIEAAFLAQGEAVAKPLVEALRDYVSHISGCDVSLGGRKCSCGLAAALAPYEASK